VSWSNDERRSIKSDSNFLGGQAVKWIVIAIIVALVIGVGLWFFYVKTSGIKGQGDAERQKNSAQNWTKQQAEFERMYASIKAQDKNITIAYKEVKAKPDDTVKQTNYAGLVRNCNDTVATYNATARSFLAEQFRAADLPAQIDETDPATDCKENDQ
jgi:uncharacterized protein HemX